jgi:hypothetical protein
MAWSLPISWGPDFALYFGYPAFMTILQKIPDRIPVELSLTEFLVWNAPGPWRWWLVEGAPEAMAPRWKPKIGGVSAMAHGTAKSSGMLGEDVQFLAIPFSVRLSEIYEGTGINPPFHDETA